jgi:putative glutamine amidotransferase
MGKVRGPVDRRRGAAYIAGMSTLSKRPLVGVPACRRQFTFVPVHYASERYLTAVAGQAGAMPIIIPALLDGAHVAGTPVFGEADLRDFVAGLDGIFMTGSPSNIEPHHYAADTIEGSTEARDPWRDATALAVARIAVELDIPLLAVCRGHQELNVALGGSLHQDVRALPGRMDHRSDKTMRPEAAYAPRHHIEISAGGRLAEAVGMTQAWVNSLHMQAIDRVAPGVTVEATAEDGTIEAVSVDGMRFGFGIQWHPEWDSPITPVNSAIVRAFGAAVRARRDFRIAGAVRAAE